MLIVLCSLLFQACFILITVGYSLRILLVGKRGQDARLGELGADWAQSCLGALRLLCRLSHEVEGAEHLPPGPCVVLCKHQSTWETLALRIILPHQQAWVLKQDLLRIPIFGWALARYRPIAIDRAAPRAALKQLFEQGQTHLQARRWVIIFPEGTRVAPGQRRPFSAGGAKLAQLAGVPVVPIAHNAGVFWGRETLRRYPGRIRLIIGPSLDTRERTVAEINAEAERWIETTMARLQTDWRSGRGG